MKKLKNFASRFWKNESAQGATEYILLLVVVVGLVMIFKGQIINIVKGKVSELGNEIRGVSSK